MNKNAPLIIPRNEEKLAPIQHAPDREDKIDENTPSEIKTECQI